MIKFFFIKRLKKLFLLNISILMIGQTNYLLYTFKIRNVCKTIDSIKILTKDL